MSRENSVTDRGTLCYNSGSQTYLAVKNNTELKVIISRIDETDLKESSESEDDLEDTPAFIRKHHLENDVDMNLKSRQKHSRLDALLAEHRREAGKNERLRVLRDQLMTELASSSDKKYEDNKDLASEHAEHIEKLKVKSIKLRTVHPGLTVFNADNFGCLFSDSIDPLSHFVKTTLDIDKIGSSFSYDTFTPLLYTRTNIDLISASPNFDSSMQLMLDLLSIHHSTSTATSIKKMMISILNVLHKMKTKVYWKPSAMGLLRLLVNLGANSQELTEFQETFTQEEIRKALVKVNGESGKQKQKEAVNSDRFHAVLEVLIVALQRRCIVPKEDLKLMFYMLAKAALDTSLVRDRDDLFSKCFAVIINHYHDSDWPAVVPDLCRQLSHVTDHHHNQVFLAGLIYADSRGSYLQMRLSYTFLYNQLMPGEHQLEDTKLQDLQLTEVAELGIPVEKGMPSTLAVRLHDLVNKDRYKAFSILKLLDMSVGDISNRATMHKRQLQYLLNQVNLLRSKIKDRVCEPDLLQVKDAMCDMAVKWSFALQDQRMNEGSIFPWATATTHQWVKPEILMDEKEQNVTDKGEDMFTDITQHCDR